MKKATLHKYFFSVLLCAGGWLLSAAQTLTRSDTFYYSGTIVQWTVPQGVTSLTITVKGAEGGTYTGSVYSASAGLGAVIKGNFALQPGTPLKILVGQKPAGTDDFSGLGGGGGSFVTDIQNNPLIIAGGGGGSGDISSSSEQGQAVPDGEKGGGFYGAAGGTGGNGGEPGSGGGGGGGGLLTDGGSSTRPGAGGQAFVNGGSGGSSTSNTPGGFGGGGGGSLTGSGGGGGYSGGGGSYYPGSSIAAGGGGGSYNGGTNQENSSGANTGNGLVVITYSISISLTCPSNITVSNTTGQCGAIVNYTTPSLPQGVYTKTVSDTFRYTGAPQSFTVPTGISALKIQAWGAQGGGNYQCTGGGGLGGYAEGKLVVNSGNVLQVYVGQQPEQVTTATKDTLPGGYNGGGTHGDTGGGGGGASDVRKDGSDLSNRILVAGGGGGNGRNDACIDGGAGGGLQGEKGKDGLFDLGNGKFDTFEGGGGGTQTEGGAAGRDGQAGSLGQGGGVVGPGFAFYVGGGGGYYGGGSTLAAGGGGGSGYIGGVTDGSMQTGINSGNGMVVISYEVPFTPTVIQTAGQPSGNTFRVGTTTNTFELRDGSTTLNSCSFTITVNDTEKPVLTCPAAQKQCYSSTGRYAIPALQAKDNCGLQSTAYSISGATSRTGTGNDASGAFNSGVSTITWTVTDVNNNQSTCQTTVTINSPIAVSIPDAKAPGKGVDVNTVYVGYAPAASLTLTANATGGSGTYTYKWNTGATTQSIKVSPTITTTYTVTVTDGITCTATTSRQVKVVDVRCGVNNSKVNVCHRGNMLCIDKGSVADHLNHGDKLGRCSTAAIASRTPSTLQEDILISSVTIDVFPNPNNGQFTLQLNNTKAGKAEVLVLNAQGSIVERRQVQLTGKGQTLSFNLGNKAGGLYIVKVISEDGVQTMKVAVQR